LYIADKNNQGIRKVAAGSGTITTVGSNSGWSGVAVDGSGNLYIADSSVNLIRKLEAGSGTITVVAGNGWAGFSGDGGAATSAQLNFPYGVAVDASGNLYIADTSNHRVRKVAADSGTITTVAGSGGQGLGGDGGAATSAQLNQPCGVAVDGGGNLYIADTNNQRIRKVAAGSGTITTVAGNGVPAFGGDGGAATSAQLAAPMGVAVDGSANLYIVDSSNNRIRKVAAGSGTITTVAGNGRAGYGGDGVATSIPLYYPYGVAADGSGNLYIADTLTHRIRKVAAGSGMITTVAGSGGQGLGGDGGLATSAQLRYPYGVAVDGSGNLYIADTLNHRIRKVAAGSGTITTVAGNAIPLYNYGDGGGYGGDGGAATSAQLNQPYGVAVDGSGNLYIADTGNQRIRKVAADSGTITTVAGNGNPGLGGDGGLATSAQLYNPSGVAVDASGNLYIADTSNHRVRKVAADSGTITTVAGSGGQGLGGDGGAATSAQLNQPYGVAVDGAGGVIVADRGNQRIRRLTPQSTITVTSSPVGRSVTVDGTSVITPQALTWDAGSTHTLSAFDPQGGSTGVQYLFSSWSQGGKASQTIIAPAANTTYTASFATQFYLTTNAVGNGHISPDSGWQNAGATVPVNATAGAGAYFLGFSGTLSGTATPQNLVMHGAASVAASFGNLGSVLTASLGSKANGALTDERLWTVNLVNTGAATATNARITNVEILQVTGTATVTLSPLMTLPVTMGTIGTGSSGSGTIALIFAATSPTTRIQIRVTYAADGGVSGQAVFNNQFR
jgi:sugar lactone lactonase YvrE